MWLKKITSGIISLSVFACSAAPLICANGADNTVRISASNESAAPGEKFTISVSLSDIPETGIQGAEFAVKYDSSVVSVDSIEAGELVQTGADDVCSIKEIPAFGSSISEEKEAVVVSFIVLTDLLGYDDPSYFMHGDGVMFTINGTVREDAPEGAVADFNIIPNPRKINDSGNSEDNSQIWLGYDSNTDIDVSEYIYYNSEVSDGSLTVSGNNIKGDVNGDASIDITDAVLIAAFVGNSEKNPLSDQYVANGDVHNTGDGLTANDALLIQQYLAGIVTAL